MSLVFFILYICKMKKIMKEKNQVVPDEVLSKEFISQFKTEADVSKFLKQLHAQVLEKMLEGFVFGNKCIFPLFLKSVVLALTFSCITNI